MTMKQETGNDKLKTKNDKKFVFVQLIDGSPIQIQQLIDILNKHKTSDFEFIITNQMIEWNTIDTIIESLSLVSDKYRKTSDKNKKTKIKKR